MTILASENPVVHCGNPNRDHYDYSKVPQALRNLPRWVVWRMEKRVGKDGRPTTTKVPIHAVALRKIDVTDLSNGQSFEVALKCYLTYATSFGATEVRGLGLLLGDGLYGIDLDHCLDNQ